MPAGHLVVTIALVAAVTGCARDSRPSVDADTARIAAADREPGNWLTHGRTYGEQRFSPLAAINPRTVKDLGLAWSYDLQMNRGAEATPLVVDGVMYVTSAWSIVHAIDARTGRALWVHDPKVMGGGALMDNGTHVADLTLHFLGKTTETAGFTGNRIWNFGGSEDNGYVLMRTAEGRVGMLHASWSEWRGYRFHLDITGTGGTIRVWYPPMMTVLWKKPEGAAKSGRRQIFLFPMMQIKERLKSYRWTVEESFIAEHLDYMERVAGRPGAGATGEDGLHAVELAYAAYSGNERPAEPELAGQHR